MKIVKLLSYGIVLSAVGFLTVSCLNNDDEPSFREGYLLTRGVYVNTDSIQPVSKTTKIEVTYQVNNKCQEFLGFQRLNNDEQNRKLVVYGRQTLEPTCKDSIFEKKVIYKFTPLKAGEYTLKFWSGKDDAGIDTYIEQPVLVPHIQ